MKRKIILAITGAFAIAGFLLSGVGFSNNVQSLSELKAAGQIPYCAYTGDPADNCYNWDTQQWIDGAEQIYSY